MFCALITLLQYFKNIKQGGCFAPSHFTGGGAKQPPCFIFLEVVYNVIGAQNMLI